MKKGKQFECPDCRNNADEEAWVSLQDRILYDDPGDDPLLQATAEHHAKTGYFDNPEAKRWVKRLSDSFMADNQTPCREHR